MYNSFVPVGHPMHMHVSCSLSPLPSGTNANQGHNFQVLAEGYGTWDGSITNENNPLRRDVQFLTPARSDGTRSYTVLQVDLDNPTINIFHCHLAWHVSGGLYVALLEQPDQIPKIHTVPQEVTDSCKKWGDWSGRVVPDQIDSGI